ncbi:MAG TPA: hypothetical protein VE090_04345 [Methylomirabilota bacterium]|nr:hypothetical protein [Methylomirabilota bacterium]
MLFAIWTGWGIVVPLLVGAAFVLTQTLGNAIFGPYFYETNDWTKVFAVILASISMWFLGRYLNKRPGRTLIDKKTGHEVVFKKNHTFFFIKVEYWAIIVPILAILVSLKK